MRLTRQEFVVLHQALMDAFLDYDDLNDVLRMAGYRLADISERRRKPAVVTRIIEHAESRDWVDELVAAARAANAENRALVEMAAAIGLEPAGVRITEGAKDKALPAVTRSLERLVDASRGIADLGSYAVKIQELLRRVCAIEVGDSTGTGFLIGPETVLTNHHVVQDVIAGHFNPVNVVLRFDYQRLRDGKTTNAGVEVGLARDGGWLVDAEPHSHVDTLPYDEDRLPAEHELDYAVLRTGDKVGLLPPSGPLEVERGWIEPLAYDYDFPAESFLMIVQHPCNDPISYDAPADAVMRVNPNSTRVHYRTNTLAGSSGSPVLNPDLELVAIHHAGEPGSPDAWKPCRERITPAAYNEGIPISSIQRRVASKELSWVFGSEAP